MSFPQLSISFDSEDNFFELSHNNFKNPVKCFNYINFKIYIVGRPIIENKIDYNKTLKILEELADNNFSKYTNLQKINGEFLFILNNQSNNQLIIINDRFCSIPLFYCNYKNKLSISTNYFEIIKFLKKNNIFQFDSFSAFEFLQFKMLFFPKLFQSGTKPFLDSFPKSICLDLFKMFDKTMFPMQRF